VHNDIAKGHDEGSVAVLIVMMYLLYTIEAFRLLFWQKVINLNKVIPYLKRRVLVAHKICREGLNININTKPILPGSACVLRHVISRMTNRAK